MNVLLLTHTYPDIDHSWRGSFIEEQANALSTRYNITIVYFKADYSRFAPFSRYTFIKRQISELTLYEVTISKSLPFITQLKYLSNTYKFLKKEIFSKSMPDLIHSHLSYPAGLLGTIIQKRNGIPNVLTEHTRIKMFFRSFIHKQCVIYALKNSSGVISVSKSLKEEIKQYRKRYVYVIPNLVDTDKFEFLKTGDNTVINIGFLGGLNNQNKGLDLLLKSVSLIKDRKFVLHIGGNGSLLNSYKKMAVELGIESICIFFGEILKNNKKDFYSGLDIFVLSSRYETFGIVLIEAMASGLPVISTRCGGPEDIVIPSTGILIEKENPEELAKAITFMVENIGSYNKEVIRTYATQTFGKSIFIDRIAKVYQDVLTRYTNE